LMEWLLYDSHYISFSRIITSWANACGKSVEFM
jgi:hypothetical protein